MALAFHLEGAPAVLLGAVAYFFLTDRPRGSHWLLADEREWIEERLRLEKLETSQAISVWRVLGSRIVLLLAAAAFMQYVVGYGFYFWFPIMLKRQASLSDLIVGVLGVIPYALMFAAMIVNGWHSDARLERRWHAAIPNFIATAGALGLTAHFRSLPVSILLFSTIALVNGFLPAFWAIPTTLLSRSAAAAAVGLINAIASVAGFASPFLLGYLSTRTGSFDAGMIAVAAAGIASGLLMLCVPRHTH